jgi:hypothetical protein
MADKKEVKIIVKTNDELSDIVDKIQKIDGDRIILTFTEPSDLLISSINLSVIKETAQEEGKSIIAQIIKNPTGERNAKKAGLISINTPSNPTEDLWEEGERETKEVKIEKEEILGQRVPKEEEEMVEKIEPQKSSFEKRIEEALSKSKAQPTSAINKTKFVEEEGVKISLDSEISHEEEKREEAAGEIEEQTDTKPQPQVQVQPQQAMTGVDINKTRAENKIPKINLSSVKEKFSNIFKFKKKDNVHPNNVIKMSKGPVKKYLIIGSVGIVVCSLIACAVYYYFAPLVKVKIYVDSKAVSIEKTFAGSAEISELDLEEQKVPLISEEVEQDASDSITPTGTSVTGEKATGTVRINYLAIGETLDLPSGSSLTASGKKFITLADLHITGPYWSELSVEAASYGSEYNVSAGTYFTVDGYSDTDVSGTALDAFTGGSKTEVTVLSQSDVDTASANLAKEAKEDAEGDLLDKHIDDEWAVIKDSIKSEVDEDSVETDIPIGSEATTANISLTVKVSALYYNKESIENIVKDLLSEEAKNKDLFETSDDTELELADDVETSFTVTGTKADSIKVKVEASGVVTPKISKDEITEKLKGMGWGEGINYLTEFDYSEQKIQISFEPSAFPEWLRYFPSRQGRLLISTIYVKE